MYTGIRLLLLIRPFISSFFFLFNFQTLKIFVKIFSGTVRLRRLKLGTHVDSGQMYRVYRNEAAPAYSSLYYTPGIRILPPVYEVYRGYTVFVFSVSMFVGVCVCWLVCKLCFRQRFLKNY